MCSASVPRTGPGLASLPCNALPAAPPPTLNASFALIIFIIKIIGISFKIEYQNVYQKIKYIKRKQILLLLLLEAYIRNFESCIKRGQSAAIAPPTLNTIFLDHRK